MQTPQDLLDLLNLKHLELDLFQGESYKAPWGRVFGGQVLAQSLRAAYETVPAERIAHSLHAYFILPGDVDLPISYKVERLRDGGSFTTRRVTAIQKERPIFNLAASFQLQQQGLRHQIEMPKVSAPDDLLSDIDLLKKMDDVPRILRAALLPRPIEFRPVEPFVTALKGEVEPKRHVWMRAKQALPSGQALHQQVFTYASDYNLLSTALLPHTSQLKDAPLQMASLDHAMWFHHDFKMDDWLLFMLDSPSASGARGFTRGSLFKQDGTLVASVVQEGLIRIKQTKA